MNFEDLPTTPRSEELVDKAFSRATRAGRAKTGIEAQESMLQTAANVLSDNLENVVTSWPNFDDIDPFYYELADATLADTEVGGVDDLRQHLSSVTWAAGQTAAIRKEYHGRLRSADAKTARKLRKQAFARLADVTEQVEDDLRRIADAREALKTLPDIRADEPAIVVAGYPNVGKSSFVNSVTNAKTETGSYPYTTTRIAVGHVLDGHLRYQLVDTPGLLDRPEIERNDIESQAVSALTHAADAVLVLLDPSEECGYPLDDQLELLSEIRDRFDMPVLSVCNKADRSTAVEADLTMSVETGDGVDETLQAAIDAIGYEPELPFDG